MIFYEINCTEAADMAKKPTPVLTPEIQARHGSLRKNHDSAQRDCVHRCRYFHGKRHSRLPKPGGHLDKFTPVYFDEFMASETARIRYWEMRMDMEKGLKSARPNTGHLSITRLYETGHLTAVITQNIDGLHQASGHSGGPNYRITREHPAGAVHVLPNPDPLDAAEEMILAGNRAPRVRLRRISQTRHHLLRPGHAG